MSSVLYVVSMFVAQELTTVPQISYTFPEKSNVLATGSQNEPSAYYHQYLPEASTLQKYNTTTKPPSYMLPDL